MTNNKKIHLEISERKILLKIFDILVVLLSLYFVSIFFDFKYFSFSKDNFYWAIVLSVYIYIFGSVFEMYNLQVASSQNQIVKSIILTTSTTVIVYLLTPILTPFLPSNRFQIILFYVTILVALFVWRIIYVHLLASHRFSKKAIIVCDEEQLYELVKDIEAADPHYKLIGYVNSNENNSSLSKIKNIKSISISDLKDFVKNNSISEIVVATQNTEGITTNLYNQLIHLLENGYIIREYTQLYENITQRIPVHYVSRDFYRYFPFNRNNQNQLYLLFVKITEILIATLGTMIMLFLIPIIFIVNFFANKGSLLYTQERVGKNGKIFNIYKFRTMVQNAEQNGAVFATTNDSRITPFGKILRKTRIDEIPQFINVLKGEMAIIGPRPERPIFVNKIAEVMPFYETRHVIKPGLTGWAQVNYSYGDSINDSLIKLQYDLYYIKHRSIFLDINIVIKTISTVLFYRGQ